MVLQGLKPCIYDRLTKYAGRWVVEVPTILWSLSTTPNQSVGFTPFFLAYGVEAVLPSDLDHSTPRVKAFNQDRAIEAQQDAVDLPKEAHETTVIRSARYQQTLAGTMKEKSEGGSSRSVISCSKELNQPRRNINSLRHGKDLIW